MSAEARVSIDDARAAYARDGYFVVEGAIPADVVEALRAAADRAVDEERTRLEKGTDRFVPVSRLNDRYVVSGFVDRDARVRAFLLGETMADICRVALGDDAYLFSETFVCKAARNENGWIWHQDSSYLDYFGCGHYPPNLSVWIALDDMTEVNGSLRVIPFSTLDVRKVVHHDFTKAWTSDEVVDFGEHPNRLLLVPKGAIVAFDGALPHASDPNRTDAPRRAYLVQYSRTPVEKDGKLVQKAIPLLRDGLFQRASMELPASSSRSDRA